MNTAAKCRIEKEKHPERFCGVRSCLWRVKTQAGYNPCRKHTPAEKPTTTEEAKNG